MFTRKGLVYALLAYGGWGFLPLYWQVFKSLPALEVLAHRMVWSAVFVWILLALSGRVNDAWAMVQRGRRKQLLWMGIGAALISVNWLTFIETVNTGQVVEASLGYYVNPLVNALLGVIVLRERLDLWRWSALGVAAVGVGISVWAYGQPPWLAGVLAMSFGLYGLIKKKAPAEAMVSLTWETTFVFPASLAYLLFLHAAGADHAAALPPLQLVLLLLAGVATATPLLWFGMGAAGLDLATLGFVQYLSPTISLLIGVLVDHERFGRADMMAFACIWLACALFSFGLFRHRSGTQKPRLSAESGPAAAG
ncbi:MAG: EamA family transporter RarD [Alicyclobacillaceae bacterium]|nr:EamA family transporter RarD [Alicyclobacillaceae bacterium]